MKRKLKWILLGVLVVVTSAGGVLAWSAATNNESMSVSKLAAAQTIDREAQIKYQEALKAAAEQAAREAAEKIAREAAAKKTNQGNSKRVTYSIAIKGSPESSLNEFRAQAAETLSDARGWARTGISFHEVSSGGDFTLWLSEAALVPSFQPSICSTVYSCSIGRNVIINDARWRGATDSWNNAGGGLRDYRHMVINHEVGHFLGHRDNERVCGGAGQLAPLMQQQSIDLRGCTFNPWPLDVELWTNR
ncbi:DUF3152 domain-containing protein [Candidatus Saccharibacteria bacterium]|nr:DUF3152 domain-containing protein [Candidatus Saccharibacteria bacterium]